MCESKAPVDFTAIDVETANPDLSSICQIGVVQFHGGAIVHRWTSYVNPKDRFDPLNASIHGITARDVSSAPTFSEIAPKLQGYLTQAVVCHHTAFDRSAIKAAHQLHGLPMPEIQWLDTARVVRRAWLDRARSGYGLRPMAEMLGIRFHHHDAGEDARAAGEILLHAVAKSGISVSDWLESAHRPIWSFSADSLRHELKDNDFEGPLSGETAVFTGELSLPRREAAAMAIQAGCRVVNSVTKSTTLLVVGDQNIEVLAGHRKSSKHRKAEANIEKGQPIRILRETDFLMAIEGTRLEAKE